MKWHNTYMDFFKGSLLLLSLGVILTSCGLGTQGDAVPQPSELQDDEGTKTDPELNFGKHALGIKNYNQIYESMQQVTGIQIVGAIYNNPRNYYNDNRTSLPKDNNAKTVSASQLLTMVNLAYEFCEEITDNNTDQQTFFAGTDFTGQPDLQIQFGTPERRLQFVQHLLDRFWGIPLEGSAYRASSEQELLELMDVLVTDFPNNSVSTRLVMRGVCAAALSSSPVTFF